MNDLKSGVDADGGVERGPAMDKGPVVAARQALELQQLKGASLAYLPKDFYHRVKHGDYAELSADDRKVVDDCILELERLRHPVIKQCAKSGNIDDIAGLIASDEWAYYNSEVNAYTGAHMPEPESKPSPEPTGERVVDDAGTDRFIELVRSHLLRCTRKDGDGTDRRIYADMVEAMPAQNTEHITVDHADIVAEPTIKQVFETNPMKVLETMRAAVVEALRDLRGDHAKYANHMAPYIQVRIANHPDVRRIRDLDSRTLNRLVCVRAKVMHVSDALHAPLLLTLRCTHDDGHERVFRPADGGARPTACHVDGCKGMMREDEGKSVYTLQRTLDLQDAPDRDRRMRRQKPAGKKLTVNGSLTDIADVGDDVVATGMHRLVRRKPRDDDGPRDSVMLGVNVEFLDPQGNRTALRTDRGEVGERELAMMEKWKWNDTMNRPKTEDEVIKMLVKSFAPWIAAKDHVKRLLLYVVMSSMPWGAGGDGDGIRRQIHVLLIGDTGTAKSKLARFACEVAPHGVFLAGTASSGTALTAVTVKDGEKWVLKLGAMSLYGMVGLDEFGRMEEGDVDKLPTAMEDGVLGTAKADVLAEVEARASIVATANPIGDMYDGEKSLDKNTHIMPALLERFDYKIPILDVGDDDEEIVDVKIRHRRCGGAKPEGVLAKDELTTWFACSARYTPKPTEAAETVMRKAMLGARAAHRKAGQRPANWRMLDALQRLAENRARLLNRDVVTEEDARDAVDTVKLSMAVSGLDVGTADTDRVDTSHVRPLMVGDLGQRLDMFRDLFEKLVRDDGTVNEFELTANLTDTGKFDNTGLYIAQRVEDQTIEREGTRAYKRGPKWGEGTAHAP